MPNDKDDTKKKYAVVPEKVTAPVSAPLLPPTQDSPPTAHPDLGTSVPDENPKPP
ncbi:MAG: hypothetical protein Q8P41_29265 [Pseudomonadota bacterium]|nr:hypothetical protein [Pseudomonadota bacterium]